MKKLMLFLLVFPLFTINAQLKSASVRFDVTFPESASKDGLDGRLLLLISTNNESEPRFQISEDLTTQQVFGVDVDGWKPGATKTIDQNAFGYPVHSLAEIKPGEYWVQALLHRYETFKRADGHTVKLPMDRGEGQQWSRAPGNLYSTPKQIRMDANTQSISIALDKVIPPIEPPKDTKYIKHIRIQSDRLTKFWGRPMYLGAHVLLPEGFDTHPEARYPLVIFHGHFPADLSGFRETPPIRISSPTTASVSSSPVTTASSRSRLTSFTRNGLVQTFRASSSSRSSTRILITTTRMQ